MADYPAAMTAMAPAQSVTSNELDNLWSAIERAESQLSYLVDRLGVVSGPAEKPVREDVPALALPEVPSRIRSSAGRVHALADDISSAIERLHV